MASPIKKDLKFYYYENTESFYPFHIKVFFDELTKPYLYSYQIQELYTDLKNFCTTNFDNETFICRWTTHTLFEFKFKNKEDALCFKMANQ